MDAVRVQLSPMQATAVVNDSFTKDAVIAWFRGEFAAANAIIDALCSKLMQQGGGYDGVFEAVHRRRMKWIPVLQMQKYHSISEIMVELGRVVVVAGAGGGTGRVDECLDKEETGSVSAEEAAAMAVAEMEAAAVDEEDYSPKSNINDSGSHETHPVADKAEICANHDDCDARAARIKLTKGFTAKEPVKGHMASSS